ncbi:hypothetical protein CLV51_10658 [Chitinophaga niastensis]|uniref:Uncharacterized protein n=1 Tax=Chitinophaga niastensis TaxID=536980 RepID=A0A2P8HD80_CHINA|nr:hypothetical protein [Chitinophaga niastensis]PSL44193.1 hypothetical protein CLV51_10658 [Chitinophaga niastensis]
MIQTQQLQLTVFHCSLLFNDMADYITAHSIAMPVLQSPARRIFITGKFRLDD